MSHVVKLAQLYLAIAIICYSFYYVSDLSISTTGEYVKNSKAKHQIDAATALEVFWEGHITTRELPANANYVEVEAPCPDGCSWEIREATEQEIQEEGKTEGMLICFLRHEGVDISTFLTSGLEMTIRLPAGSPIVITLR